jgi:uncharacterized protein (TIGR02453 family)
VATFSGFPRDAFQFLHELSTEMNREWFEANKARYQAVWVEPMQALADDVAAALGKAYAPLKAKLKAPKVFRIYRDVRFAKDKSPYKTHVAMAIGTAAGRTALYMHLGLEEDFAGAGAYYFEPPELPKWRKLVAAERSGAELTALVGKLRKAGYAVGGHEDFVRVPKPFAADHPRADYLRMRGLTVAFPAIPKGLVHDKGFAKWLVGHAAKSAPLVAWLGKHVPSRAKE